jgi:hypothetical protein
MDPVPDPMDPVPTAVVETAAAVVVTAAAAVVETAAAAVVETAAAAAETAAAVVVVAADSSKDPTYRQGHLSRSDCASRYSVRPTRYTVIMLRTVVPADASVMARYWD